MENLADDARAEESDESSRLFDLAAEHVPKASAELNRRLA